MLNSVESIFDIEKNYACCFTFLQASCYGYGKPEYLLLSNVSKLETKMCIGNNDKLFRTCL